MKLDNIIYEKYKRCLKSVRFSKVRTDCILFIIRNYNKTKLLAKRNCTKAKTQREKSGWLAGIICMQTPHYVHSFLAID